MNVLGLFDVRGWLIAKRTRVGRKDAIAVIIADVPGRTVVIACAASGDLVLNAFTCDADETRITFVIAGAACGYRYVTQPRVEEKFPS